MQQLTASTTKLAEQLQLASTACTEAENRALEADCTVLKLTAAAANLHGRVRANASLRAELKNAQTKHQQLLICSTAEHAVLREQLATANTQLQAAVQVREKLQTHLASAMAQLAGLREQVVLTKTQLQAATQGREEAHTQSSSAMAQVADLR